MENIKLKCLESRAATIMTCPIQWRSTHRPPPHKCATVLVPGWIFTQMYIDGSLSDIKSNYKLWATTWWTSLPVTLWHQSHFKAAERSPTSRFSQVREVKNRVLPRIGYVTLWNIPVNIIVLSSVAGVSKLREIVRKLRKVPGREMMAELRRENR